MVVSLLTPMHGVLLRTLTEYWFNLSASSRAQCLKHGKQLSSMNLKEGLIRYECQPHQITGLVQLIEYTIDNAPAIEEQRAYDLRKIVLDFTAIIVEILAKNESFKQLQRSTLGFNIEVLKLLMRRLDW